MAKSRQTADEALVEAQNEVNEDVSNRAQEILDENPNLTPFEAAQNARFEDQNEAEARIDDAAAGLPATDMAGNPVVVDTSEILVGSATQTVTPGLQPNPYPPTDFGYVLVAGDITADPTLTTRGYIATNPAPPENNFADLKETDAVNDTKDYSRRYRAPNDAIVAAYRNKYPTQIGGFAPVEPPA